MAVIFETRKESLECATQHLVRAICKVTLKCQFLILPGTINRTQRVCYRDATARFRMWETWYAFRSLLTAAMKVATEFAGLARPAKWEGLGRKVGQG